MPGLPGPVESVRIGIRDACVHSLAFCDGLPVRTWALAELIVKLLLLFFVVFLLFFVC